MLHKHSENNIMYKIFNNIAMPIIVGYKHNKYKVLYLQRIYTRNLKYLRRQYVKF